MLRLKVQAFELMCFSWPPYCSHLLTLVSPLIISLLCPLDLRRNRS